MKLSYIGLLALTVSAQRISKKQAASLFRKRRDNGGVFEELKAPNLERECIEESCSFQELVEALPTAENHHLAGFADITDETALAKALWASYTRECSEPGACDPTGTATCTNEWRNHVCTCREGFVKTDESQDCSLDRDECAIEGWCSNGATCTNTHGSFNCDCPAGWGGDRCDEDVDECLLEDSCLNGGVCTNTEGSFTCACNEFWRGARCEEDINECAENNPCVDSGCINSQGSYECLCTNGKGGKHCDEDFDECAHALCPAGTECISMDDGAMYGAFQCVCPERGCNNLDQEEYDNKLSLVYDPNNVEEVVEVALIDVNATGSDYSLPEYESESPSNETSVDSYEIEEYEAPEAYDSYNAVEAEVEVEEQEYDNTIDLPVEEESDYTNEYTEDDSTNYESYNQDSEATTSDYNVPEAYDSYAESYDAAPTPYTAEDEVTYADDYSY